MKVTNTEILGGLGILSTLNYVIFCNRHHEITNQNSFGSPFCATYQKNYVFFSTVIIFCFSKIYFDSLQLQFVIPFTNQFLSGLVSAIHCFICFCQSIIFLNNSIFFWQPSRLVFKEVFLYKNFMFRYVTIISVNIYKKMYIL